MNNPAPRGEVPRHPRTANGGEAIQSPLDRHASLAMTNTSKGKGRSITSLREVSATKQSRVFNL